MKNPKYVYVVFMLCLLLTASQNALAQEAIFFPEREPPLGDIRPEDDNFALLSVEAETDKQAYMPFEPIAVTLTFTNRTNTLVTTEALRRLSATRLRVTRGKEIKTFDSLISASDGISYIHPMRIHPGKSFEKKFVLDDFLDDFFPTPGKYQIQFLERGGSAKTHTVLESNVIDVEITAPTGIDKAAYDFIMKNKDKRLYPMTPVEWKPDAKGEGEENLTETFVRKYGSSYYGERAKLSLGLQYRSKKDLVKARAVLEPLKFSANEKVAAQATQSLKYVEEDEKTFYSPERLPPTPAP